MINFYSNTGRVRGLFAGKARSVLLLSVLAPCATISAQTGGTGAVSGTLADASGSLVTGAKITIVNTATNEERATQSDTRGTFFIPSLPPGLYRVTVVKEGFKTTSSDSVSVAVTETRALNLRLEVGGAQENVVVTADEAQLQTETSALGLVTDGVFVEHLPLVTRNYTQIIGLNAGVSANVNNAAELGRGSGGMGGGFISQGGTATDNNFHLDGLPVNDIEQTPGATAGTPIPNPDTISQFKVQTGLFDATSGRNAGADVDVVTKTGTNSVHGALFYYFRNEALNANEWFNKSTGQRRQPLRQNQYGFTLGGPVKKDKILLFGSYQGTQQLNGVASTCHSTAFTPPFTNDRSQAGLGKLFAGQRGFIQNLLGGFGPAIKADGSNIAPQAIALLNQKLPNGQYLIATPQQINLAKPFDSQGVSSVSDPCTFSENQYLANGDYLQSQRSKIGIRYFTASSNADNTLIEQTPGFAVHQPQRFDAGSISHTFIINAQAVNQFEIGLFRTKSGYVADQAFSYSDLGINASPTDNITPDLLIGALALGNTSNLNFLNDVGEVKDSLFYTRGRHQLIFGGGFNYGKNEIERFNLESAIIALTWADFLLGQNATQLGTAALGIPIGNIYGSIDLYGNTARDYRYKEANAFVQDNYKLSSRLTFNLGVRYEKIGDLADAGGRNGNIYASKLNPNPPAGGTIQGYVVPNNFKGTVPTGVQQLNNGFGFDGIGTNTFNPRLGFEWILPGSDKLLMRGGAGLYHTRPVGQINLQLTTQPPYGIFNELLGAANGGASLANPFPAQIALPAFTPYSPTTDSSLFSIAPDLRPPTSYKYNLGFQSELPSHTVLEVTYVGARELHQIGSLSLNQASLASPTNPIRGVTTNTVANVALRKPQLGFTPDTFRVFDSNGAAWYNALQTTYSRRYTSGLQLQAAFTWSKLLNTQPGTTSGTSFSGTAGNEQSGNQFSQRARYGADPLIRPERLVITTFYALPGLRSRESLAAHVLNDWNVAGIATMQSGAYLTATYSNTNNAYGISEDRPSLAALCTTSNLMNPGSVSSKVNGYLNKSCFTTPAIIGSDGVATDFGNAGVGDIRGSGQFNIDLSLSKRVPIRALSDTAGVQFRADAFNSLNHPIFGDPVLEYSNASFGAITSTVSNPRVVQFALRFEF